MLHTSICMLDDPFINGEPVAVQVSIRERNPAV